MSTDLTLARLSGAIYQSEDTFRQTVRDHGLSVGLWVDRQSTQAAFVYDDHWQAIVFRGTQVSNGGMLERVTDLWTNAKIWPAHWAGKGRAHAGYAQAVERVRPDAERMTRTATTGCPLYFAGHSLGGVLAHLAAVWVRSQGMDVWAVVTFGAPRGGNVECWAPLAADRVRRYVVRGDWAPSWPPVPWIGHPRLATPLQAPDAPSNGLLGRHDISGYVSALK